MSKYIQTAIFCLALMQSRASDLSEPMKRIAAMRVHSEIHIDGILSEEEWLMAEAASDFIQNEPIPGANASFRTEAYFLYDDQAVYIGARLYDPEPQKILRELCIRDNSSNSDLFKVFLDPYQSGLNGFSFSVNAAGVQSEAIVSNHSEDLKWNAVWESQVKITEMGWIVEIKIPHSSLRFPERQSQQWNLQYIREIRRFRETSHWSRVDPLINGWVQQSGLLDSLNHLKSPVRLSLMPFITGYLNGNKNTQSYRLSPAYSAGADLKYGINQAFTLDMALIPDFGQVISDKQVLNLRPFEVFFEENRQFFTEGTELFNRDGLFYSRRVGATPYFYGQVFNELKPGETIRNNPAISQLYNATKISGRTSRGTGLGFFNALVGREYATIADSLGNERKVLTNPLSNYNILVLDQNLRNNSYIRITNTHVGREGNALDAHVLGVSSELKSRDQTYALTMRGVISQRYQKGDFDRGYSSTLRFGKFGGKWLWSLMQVIETDRYNPNDLGFLTSPNEHTYTLTGAYQEFKPKNQKLQLFNFKSSMVYSRLYKPNAYQDYFITLSHFLLWRSRDAISISARLEPFDTRDYFEPRTADFSRYLPFPENYTLAFLFSSDYRKPFALDVRADYRDFDFRNRSTTTFSFRPRMRFSDKFSLFSDLIISRYWDDPGYVNKTLIKEVVEGLDPQHILIGFRDRWIVDNSLSARYVFNHKMGFTMRIRHYWDQVIYHHFGGLESEGYVKELDFDGKDDRDQAVFDQNFNIFNIDLQFNWRFAPGSDLVFVWKNQIFGSSAQLRDSYLRSVAGLWNQNQTDSISLRLIYFLDYLDAEAWIKRKHQNNFDSDKFQNSDF